MARFKASTKPVSEQTERERIVEYVLRYELYRHRDISDRISNLLKIDSDPEAFNRSTWDILFFLMQSYLQQDSPNVTDIYLATGMSKGTAISGLAELERRHAIRKIRDDEDGRRRRIDISLEVAELLEAFVTECGDKLGQPFETGTSTSANNDTGAEHMEPLIGLLNQLSHELRTPLTAIVGFSEMIADETLGPVHPVGYAEYARDIRRAASHILESLNELVDTTLAERGVALPLGVLSSVDLEVIIDKSCRATADLADRRSITLRRKWGTSKGNIVGDKDRLTQAFRKLIMATVATAGKNQTVDVETTFDITKGILVRIISPEPPNAPTRPDNNVTIGTQSPPTVEMVMPLVKAVIEAHGGTIQMQKEYARRYVTQVRLPTKGPG